MKRPAQNHSSQILAIVGPTASGKTDLGLQLAREQNGEIISADSRQVYKFLSVGTAKPIRPDIPYHLIDIWDPSKAFTAADFVRLATEKIAEIQARGKKPILVGGTGLYLKALQEGLAPLPPRDEALRTELRRTADKKGRAFLHAELLKVDPEAAAKIPANNIQRVIRALEVHRLTGKPISQWHREHQNSTVIPASRKPGSMDPPLTTAGDDGFERISLMCVGIDLSREELHQRIESRCRAMLDQGLIEETQALLKRGYPSNCPALTGLGYPRVVAFLQNQLSRDHLLELLIQDTRQYAKRQRTWFRHQMKVQWKKL